MPLSNILIKNDFSRKTCGDIITCISLHKYKEKSRQKPPLVE